MKAQGVEARHIQTTDFSVQPKYKHYKDGRPAVITGYRVVNSVSITVTDIARLGAILDRVVSLGSNKIGGISFSIAETEKLTDAARKKAMADARRKAEIYAGEAGAELGEVMSISENVASPAPRRFMARAAMEAAAPAPIEAGEQALQVRVNVTWELK
jgi:uncharacterized protein YggE